MAEKKKHNFVQSGTNNVTADKPQQKPPEKPAPKAADLPAL